jgi:hypothetical protein
MVRAVVLININKASKMLTVETWRNRPVQPNAQRPRTCNAPSHVPQLSGSVVIDHGANPPACIPNQPFYVASSQEVVDHPLVGPLETDFVLSVSTLFLIGHKVWNLFS